MKKIEKAKIEKTIKKEHKIACDWVEADRRRYYKMMIDTEDGEIWSDCFVDKNDNKRYKSETIESLCYDSETGYVGSAIQILESAGWEII